MLQLAGINSHEMIAIALFILAFFVGMKIHREKD